MAGNLAILRSQVESALAGRVSAPFSYRDRKIIEAVSAGIPEIDSLAGGLPRGGLTEICGPPCSGRTSLLISALAERTAHDEVCALVDGRDTFDPHSAESAGVELKQLLWVRCRNIDQAFRATDLLIQGGGFGLIALDLSDIPAQTVRYIPLNAWFRFRRAVEDTPTILIVLEQEPNAKTCASLVLRLGNEPALWSTTMTPHPADFSQHPSQCPSACLLDSFEVSAEVLRSRMQGSESHVDLGRTGTSAEHFTSADALKDLTGVPSFAGRRVGTAANHFAPISLTRHFKTKSLWSYPSGVTAALKQK
jgi:recombination protein RecA